MPDVAQPTTVTLPRPQTVMANAARDHDAAQATTVTLAQPLTVYANPAR